MKVSEITVQNFSRANNDKIKERFPLNSKFQQVKNHKDGRRYTMQTVTTKNLMWLY